MDPRIGCESNKENLPPTFSSASSKHGLGPSFPRSKCNKLVRRRRPLEDITHLFVPHIQPGAAGSSVAYSIDRDLVSGDEDVVFYLRNGGGAVRRTSHAKTKAIVMQRTCRPSLRKSLR